jgi:hypothetical protein
LRKRFSNHRDVRHSGRGSEFPEQGLSVSPPAFVRQANEEAIVAFVQVATGCGSRSGSSVHPARNIEAAANGTRTLRSGMKCMKPLIVRANAETWPS